jgi:hypothetical protein
MKNATNLITDISAQPMFTDRHLFIATNHKKEEVIRPILEQRLLVLCETTAFLDTDQFGTFSGEVDRALGPMETLKAKCEYGKAVSGLDLVLATEGSFGPHPFNPFCSAHDELILLQDFKNNLSFSTRILSTDTNFNQKNMETWLDLQQFANKVGFPDHRIILRDQPQSVNFIVKGIGDWKSLQLTFEACMEKHGSVYAETDMRAMHNPLRMHQIQLLTEKLMDKMNVFCPACNIPGYGVVRTIVGLPCAVCATPTESILAEVHGCTSCGFEEVREHPSGRKTEDPTFCPSCNP